jgi:chromosome segregation ATPase
MNEEPTKDLPSKSSFEERVFARFDALDGRFDSVDARFEAVETRLEKLESRASDTKPIWERALAAIMETGLEIGEIKKRIGGIETKVEVLETEIGIIKADRSVRNELVDMRRELRHDIREKLDLILKFLLEDREDIRDAEDKIRQLETKLA